MFHETSIDFIPSPLGWARRILPVTIVIAALLGFNGAASATMITSTTGQLTAIAPPLSVLEEALESDTQFFIFQEIVSFLLPSNLAVDATAAGTYTADPPNTSIAGNTRVDSYFVHADPLDTDSGGSASPITYINSSVTFSRPVLGIIAQRQLLDLSDPLLGYDGPPPTQYPGIPPPSAASLFRGTLDTAGGGDSITISADKLTVTFNTYQVGNNFLEQLRIIVEADPVVAMSEPGSLGLFSSLLIVLGWFSRHKRVI